MMAVVAVKERSNSRSCNPRIGNSLFTTLLLQLFRFAQPPTVFNQQQRNNCSKSRKHSIALFCWKQQLKSRPFSIQYFQLSVLFIHGPTVSRFEKETTVNHVRGNKSSKNGNCCVLGGFFLFLCENSPFNFTVARLAP